MTIDQLIRSLDPDRMLDRVAKQAGSTIAGEALAVARKWSSGGWSSAALRIAGHPYRRGGPNFLDPGLINAQTGLFRSSWRVEKVNVATMATNRGTSLYLVNDALHADFMFGTVRMIERPIWQRIEEDLQEGYERAIMEAVEDYWKRWTT